MLRRDIIGFVLLEGLIYGSFTLMDISSIDPTWNRVSVALKILSIALCLVFLIRLSYCQPRNRDNRLMVLIMSLTLASDVLLLTTRQFTYGLVLFVCVQLLYSIRIRKHFELKSMMLKAASFFAITLFFMMRFSQNLDYTLMLSLGTFYALLFTMNLIALSHEVWHVKGDGSASEIVYDKRLFLIGLIMYAICDLNVAIYNFPSFFDSNEVLARVYDMSALAMWLFYLPGQVALTLSVRRKVDGISGG